jgi:lipoprotein-anchoring transpeptidase ErfK/SrfK
MWRRFAWTFVTCAVAAGLGILNPPAAHAQNEPVDSGQRPAYRQVQSNFGGGLIAALFGDGLGANGSAPAYAPQYYTTTAATRQPQYAPRGLLQFDSLGSVPQPDQYVQPGQAPDEPAPQLLARADPSGGYAPAGAGDLVHPSSDPKYDRQVVDYPTNQKPGTIVIDTPHFFLYLVLEGGKALRYGIGVGRPGFTWAGMKQISAKREWPDWYPPSEMLQRRPDLPRFMPGGPNNPLGARALYLGSTLYRIHGSNEPWTIGTQVSSGCIRLRNEDVIDLYQRVKVGAKVVVL